MHPSSTTLRSEVSAAWWLYFAAVVALSILSLLRGPSSPGGAFFAVFSAFGLLGLWGYIRQVAIGWPQVWAGYFVVSLLVTLVGLVLTAANASPLDSALVIFLLLGVVLSVPLYVALWRYAFRSAHIWSGGAA